MPDTFVEYGKTWQDKHPDWKMILWTDENIQEITLQNQDLFNKTDHPVLRADMARFELIYKFGGVYIDCDFECIKNIEPLLGGVEAFSSGEMPGIVSTAIMGCTEGNQVFKMLIDAIPQSVKENAHLPINYQTGPFFTTKLLKDRDDIVIFGTGLFYPYLPLGPDSPAYAVHHFAGSW
jgi:mannosyltransferase OCH1-like enzyme